MERNKNPTELKSGTNWFSGLIGFGCFVFAALATAGGSTFEEIWGIWLFAFLGLWVSRTDEFWLSDDTFIERDMFWRKKSYDLDQLKWIDFRTKNSIFIWFDRERKEIKTIGRKGKRIRTAIANIGQKRLPYFGYVMAERSELARGQLSGCLDCHQIYSPTELKHWEKLPKSFWWGRKRDKYFSCCPSCKGGWIYTHPNLATPVNKEALRRMDDTFEFDKKTKIRDIIGETLAYQTSFSYLK